ncbi:MAG: hypothetical protein R6U68_08540 [Desulfobacteraceae bacterium]
MITGIPKPKMTQDFFDKVKVFDKTDNFHRTLAFWTHKGINFINAFLAGDAAGLAKRDMGKGIGPGIKSGILAARSIAWNRPYSLESVQRFSLPRLLLQRFPL